MLVVKPKYNIINKPKKRIPKQQTIEPTTEYGAEPKSKRQRIDSLINGKGIIYE